MSECVNGKGGAEGKSLVSGVVEKNRKLIADG